MGTYLIREDTQLLANIRRDWWGNGRILAYVCTNARNLAVIGEDFS